jgi:fatty acid synthase subunit beta
MNIADLALTIAGFSIVDIIRRNPKELTVHFGGVNGRRIRQNYLNITHQKIGPDGIARTAPVFETITETSQSHTYRSPTGVLFSTQFTQPAICMVEFARIKDMESKGLLPTDCMFAGHSLGEFPALTSFANIMTIENMCVNLFYRGMIMQVAVNRDDKGASNFAMCAINPSRVSKYLDDAGLSYVVDQVARDTGMLLEIVNWNVSSRQYVCAGELRAQDCLSAVLRYISQHKEITFSWLKNLTSTSAAASETSFLAIIHKYSTSSSIKPSPLVLERDVGFVPLPGVDVPFHSTFLRKGIDSFRALLRTQIDPVNAKPEILVGRYIPNLMGKPFSLEKEYVEECYRMTGSKALQKVLENWQPAAIAA